MSKLNNKGKLAVEILIWLITIVLTSAAILLLVKTGMIAVKADTPEPDVLDLEFIPLGRGGTLALLDIKFCESVGADFTCRNQKEVFSPGDEVYIVFLAETSNYQGDVLLRRNYRLRNPLGEVILEFAEENVYTFEKRTTLEKEVVAFSDYFATTFDFPAGYYTVDLRIENPLLNQQLTATKRFELR